MKRILLLLTVVLPTLLLAQEQEVKGENKQEVDFDALQARIAAIEKQIKGQVTKKPKSSNNLVYFNFASPNGIDYPKNIKEGEFYRVVIDDINLNQYQVLIESADTILSKPLSFPVFGSLDLSSITSLISKFNFSSESTSKETNDVIAKLLNDDASKSAFQTHFFEMADTSFKCVFNNLQSQIDDQTSDSLKIVNKVDESMAHAKKLLFTLEVAKKSIDKRSFDYMQYKLLRQASRDSSDMYPDLKKPHIREDLKSYQILQIELDTLKRGLDKYLANLESFKNEPAIAIALARPTFQPISKKLDLRIKALEEIKASIGKARALVSNENVEKQIRAVLYLYEENKYTSLPIQFNGEEASLKMKFIPKDTLSGLQAYTLPELKFPKRSSYWSVGPSIYYAKFKVGRVGYDNIQVNDSVNNVVLLREEPLTDEIGAALLMRGGYRFPSVPTFGVHFSAGTGVSLGESIKPRMLFGGGVSLGQKHSLVLDFGGIGGYVEKVSENADFGKNYTEKPSVLITSFQFQFFYSIGYAYRF